MICAELLEFRTAYPPAHPEDLPKSKPEVKVRVIVASRLAVPRASWIGVLGAQISSTASRSYGEAAP